MKLDEVNGALKQRLSADDLVLSVLATEPELGAELRGVSGLASVEVVPFDADT